MSVEEEIIAIHKRINEAIVARDFEWLENYYPDDMVIRHSGGVTQTKSEWLKTLKDGTFRYYDYHLLEANVTPIGKERATLSFRATTDALIYGYRKVWKMQFDTTFKKINGEWKPA